MPMLKASTARSDSARSQFPAPSGRKNSSTSKPMWKLSWTPTAEPRKMNQLISRIATGSTHKRLSFTT